MCRVNITSILFNFTPSSLISWEFHPIFKMLELPDYYNYFEKLINGVVLFFLTLSAAVPVSFVLAHNFEFGVMLEFTAANATPTPNADDKVLNITVSYKR